VCERWREHDRQVYYRLEDGGAAEPTPGEEVGERRREGDGQAEADRRRDQAEREGIDDGARPEGRDERPAEERSPDEQGDRQSEEQAQERGEDEDHGPASGLRRDEAERPQDLLPI